MSRRNNGPIIDIDTSQQPITALSVQYTGWRGTLELEAFRRIQHASNVTEFQDALQFFDFGSQNFSYADVHGNIAYFSSAEMPIRENLQNLGFPAGGIPPYLIRDGTHTLPHEWLAVQNPQPQQALGFEILPFPEMPQVVNPAMGYVINGNNDPIGTSLDNDPLNQLRPGGGIFYLSPGYVSLRVGRIGRLMESLLADGNQATLDDMKAIQANNQLLDAEIASSVAATIWSVFRGQITQNVIDGTLTALGLGDFTPGSRLAYSALAHHLMTFDTHQGVGASGVHFFPGPAGFNPEQAKDLILLQNLRSALDLLASDTFAPAFGNSTDQDDYRWGYLHRIELDHLLGGPFSIPPAPRGGWLRSSIRSA